jgi:hypothetical protein
MVSSRYLALMLGAAPLAVANAQSAQVPPTAGVQSAPPASTAPDSSDEEEDIVISGKPPRGSVVGDIPPDNVMRARDVKATGATNFDELLESIGPEIGSARDAGAARPLVLLNGRRVSGYRELRDIPIEAIQRIDILPEEVALKYGYRADQKVVNIVLKPRFKSTTAQLAGNTSAGGYTGGTGDVTRTGIDPHGRTTINVHAGGDDILNAAQRDLAQQRSASASSASGIGLPSELRLRAGATANWDLPGTAQETVNLEVEHDVGRALTDLTAQLPVKAHRETITDSLHAGTVFNGDAGQWHWSLTGTANYEQSRTDSRSDFTVFAPDDAHTTRVSGDADATVNGDLFRLPAGPVGTTLRVGAGGEQLDVDQPHIGEWAPESTGRSLARGSVNLDVPITHRGRAFGALGNLTLNGNAEVDQLSDFGTLATLGAGADWSPVQRLNLLANWTRDEVAPSVSQLGNPILDTPDTHLFDFTNGMMSDVDVISGGNPDLRTERRRTLKIGGNWQPFQNVDLRLRADYVHSRIDRPISALTVSPQIESAFPDRFVRDSSGDLVSADLRPVSFDWSKQDSLRIGFDFTKALRSRRATASMIDQAVQRARQAGIDVSQTPSPGGTSSPDQLAQLAAVNHGRLQFSLTDTVSFVDRAEIAPGAPVLDYLHGAAIGETGGEPRHDVQAQAGWFNNGVGARIGFNWRSATDVDTVADGPLHFSPLATFDLRLFANVGQDLKLVAKAPWLLGSSVRFEVGNIFNARPRVEDASGERPLGYEADQLEPLGRTVMLSFRKQFLPKSYYGNQLQNLEQRLQPQSP